MAHNPYQEMAKAARGDLDAQRALARMAVELITANPAVDEEAVLREGLVFARLAAEQGNEGDQGLVISMLALHARTLPEADSAIVLGEALARYSAIASRGAEVPGIAFEDLVASASPEIVEQAIGFQQAMSERVCA